MHYVGIIASAPVALVVGLSACSAAHTGSPAHVNSAATRPPSATAAATSTSPSPATPAGAKPAGFCSELGLAQDPSALTNDPAAYKSKLDQIVNDAPPEIRPDLAKFAQIAGDLADGKPGATNEFQQPGVLQNVQHFVSWLNAHCPGADVPTSATG